MYLTHILSFLRIIKKPKDVPRVNMLGTPESIDIIENAVYESAVLASAIIGLIRNRKLRKEAHP